MSIILSLFSDRNGASSIRTALMLGLSSSAVLVVVRIGVAVASQ